MTQQSRAIGAARREVAGIDAGRLDDDSLVWVMATSGVEDRSDITFEVSDSLHPLWRMAQDARCRVVAIDMPFGLPDGDTFRRCDEEVREWFGQAKRGEAWMRDVVFMPPPLHLMWAGDAVRDRWKDEVSTGSPSHNRVRLLDRCRELRSVLRVADFGKCSGPRAVEVHAELCFWKLNNDRPVLGDKRTQQGMDQRLTLLRNRFGNINEALRVSQAREPASRRWDHLDAAVAAWMARRAVDGIAGKYGERDLDATDFPMTIWF